MVPGEGSGEHMCKLHGKGGHSVNMISYPLGRVQHGDTLGTLQWPPPLGGGCLPVRAVLDLVLLSQ